MAKNLKEACHKQGVVQLFLHVCTHLWMLEYCSGAEPAHKPIWQVVAGG